MDLAEGLYFEKARNPSVVVSTNPSPSAVPEKIIYEEVFPREQKNMGPFLGM